MPEVTSRRMSPPATRYVVVLAAISAFMLAAPIVIDQLAFLNGDTRVTVRNWFNLAIENNVGAWWAGLLLFLGAMHAFDGFERYRAAGELRMSRAWLIVSAMLMGLSLDEVGSLHERLDSLMLLPIGLALMAAAGWAFWQIWSAPTERRSVTWMVIAFACFASVVGQEYLEHNVDWPAWAIPLRTGIEEGVELFGMLLLIAATMHHTGGRLNPEGREERPVFSLAHSMPGWLLLPLVAAVPLLAVGSAMLPDQARGLPANWLSAVLFLLAALACLRGVLSREPRTYFSRVGVALLLTAASAASVQVAPTVGELAGMTFSVRLVVLAVLLAAVTVLGRARDDAGRFFVFAWAGLGLFAVAFALAAETLLSIYLLNGVLALAAYRLAWQMSASPREHSALDVVSLDPGSRPGVG